MLVTHKTLSIDRILIGIECITGSEKNYKLAFLNALVQGMDKETPTASALRRNTHWNQILKIYRDRRSNHSVLCVRHSGRPITLQNKEAQNTSR